MTLGGIGRWTEQRDQSANRAGTMTPGVGTGHVVTRSLRDLRAQVSFVKFFQRVEILGLDIELLRGVVNALILTCTPAQVFSNLETTPLFECVDLSLSLPTTVNVSSSQITGNYSLHCGSINSLIALYYTLD